jgi:hypothetical protein
LTIGRRTWFDTACVTFPASFDDRLEKILPRLHNAVPDSAPRPAKGRLGRLLGGLAHARVPQVPLAELCHLGAQHLV